MAIFRLGVLFKKKMRILSYNCFAIASYPIRCNGAEERMKRVGDVLASSVPNVDILCLQEVGLQHIRDIVTLALVQQFPYISTQHTTGLFASSDIRFIGSGLLTLSRFPIVAELFVPYKGMCSGSDCLMAKGILVTRIKTPDGVVNVVNTHLQAFMPDIAVKQCVELAATLELCAFDECEPVFIVGDFNIDLYTQHEKMIQVEQVLRAQRLPLISGSHKFTVDPSINTLVGNDDPGSYVQQASDNGCYETLLRTGVCVCCSKELVDHAFVPDKNKNAVKNVGVEVVILRSSPFVINYNLVQTRVTQDISDHFALSVSFDFTSINKTLLLWKPPQLKSKRVEFMWAVLETLLFITALALLFFLKHIISRLHRRLFV